MSMLRIFSQSVINVVICLSVRRVKAFPLKNSILSSVSIVSRILYALPDWGGFLTADLIGKIDGYLCKAIRWRYTGNLKLLSELLYDADMKLFSSMLHSTRELHGDGDDGTTAVTAVLPRLWG